MHPLVSLEMDEDIPTDIDSYISGSSKVLYCIDITTVHVHLGSTISLSYILEVHNRYFLKYVDVYLLEHYYPLQA